MQPFRLTRRQAVPVPIDEIFAFFDRPENLAVITPPDMGFHILTPSPIHMQRGAVIDYTVNVLPGVPMHWRTLITAHEPPHLFVDEQIAGPYAFWHHTHRFEEIHGGTVIHDDIRYLLPFGALGNRFGSWLVKPRLKAIFDHRVRVVRERFGEL